MAAEDFKFEFTEEMALELLRGNEEAEDWYDAICEILPLWEIDTAERVAMFIAQCGHESNNFRVLSENLNYSAKGLNAVFPKYFERAGRDANEYHRQPRKIANVIYANRMDNGDTDSGDGWRFRGGWNRNRGNLPTIWNSVRQVPRNQRCKIRTSTIHITDRQCRRPL